MMYAEKKALQIWILLILPTYRVQEYVHKGVVEILPSFFWVGRIFTKKNFAQIFFIFFFSRKAKKIRKRKEITRW